VGGGVVLWVSLAVLLAFAACILVVRLRRNR
jgi:hypothetical protein